MKFFKISELEHEFDTLIESIMSQYPSLEKELAYNYFSDLLIILRERPESLVDKLVELSTYEVAPAQYALALIRARDVKLCQQELANKFGVIAKMDLSRILISYHLAKLYLTKFLVSPNRGVTGYEVAAQQCLSEIREVRLVRKILDVAKKQHPYLTVQARVVGVNELKQVVNQSPALSLN